MECLEFLGGYRSRKEIALPHGNSCRAEGGYLELVFNTLGNYLDMR